MQTWKEMCTFLVPALGAAESEQLQEKHVPALRGATAFQRRALPARGHPTFLGWCQEKPLCLGEWGSSRKEKEGQEALTPPQAKNSHSSPSSLLQAFPRPSSGKHLLDFHHGQMTHFRQMLLPQMGMSPHSPARDS